MIKNLFIVSALLGVISSPSRANPLLKPSPLAVGVAQQLGFPPVPPKSEIIGPFTDNIGLFYADRGGE